MQFSTYERRILLSNVFINYLFNFQERLKPKRLLTRIPGIADERKQTKWQHSLKDFLKGKSARLSVSAFFVAGSHVILKAKSLGFSCILSSHFRKILIGAIQDEGTHGMVGSAYRALRKVGLRGQQRQYRGSFAFVVVTGPRRVARVHREVI